MFLKYFWKIIYICYYSLFYFSHTFSCIPSSPQTHHVVMDYLEFFNPPVSTGVHHLALVYDISDQTHSFIHAKQVCL